MTERGASVHCMFTVNRHPSLDDLRRFSRAMLLGFGVLGAVAWAVSSWRSPDVPLLAWSPVAGRYAAVVLWGLGVGLFIVAKTPLARNVYVAWMSVATAIGVVMSTILLTLMYVLLLPWFVPFVRRSDPLRRRRHDGETYWEDCKPYAPTLDRMRRIS